MYKKNITPEQAHDLLVSAYTNKKFIGDRLLVYNENILAAFINQNIDGIDSNIVEAVGIPRLDRYFRLKSRGNNIIFFSFYLEDKLRHLNLPEDVLKDYIERGEKFHIEVLKYAHSNPGQKMVIKVKNNIRYLNYVKKIAEENGYSDLKNLVITNTGNVYDHIKNSFAVIGYNSTALLESFIAGRLVMSPDFRDGVIRDFFDGYPGLANYVETMEDIENVIARAKSFSIDSEELNSLLHDRIYIPDGKACKRTEKSILNTIDMVRKHAGSMKTC